MHCALKQNKAFEHLENHRIVFSEAVCALRFDRLNPDYRTHKHQEAALNSAESKSLQGASSSHARKATQNTVCFASISLEIHSDNHWKPSNVRSHTTECTNIKSSLSSKSLQKNSPAKSRFALLAFPSRLTPEIITNHLEVGIQTASKTEYKPSEIRTTELLQSTPQAHRTHPYSPPSVRFHSTIMY